MQFTAAAVLALAATVVSAGSAKSSLPPSTPPKNQTVSYVTSIYTAYTTVCPASTELTFNGVTYTATESTTLTITNCPCTVVHPVSTSSVVYSTSCAAPSVAPPVYSNNTTPAVGVPTKSVSPVGTTTPKGSSGPSPTNIAASGANQAFALSGASLAGVLGLAAYFL